MKDYWCCLITRDGASTIGETLDSIRAQSIPPKFIVVINDGSEDETLQIIEQKKSPEDQIINTFSNTRDIRRVPCLLNLGLASVRSRKTEMPKYMMVSGDDNWLDPNYANSILEKMESDERIAVASGSWLGSGEGRNQMPHGGGRFIRMDFMQRTGLYPIAYGWETWLLYKALEVGYSVKNFGKVRYRHLRPYTTRNLLGWGRAMYSLGFPSYFVLMRFVLNFLWSKRGTQSRKASITMVAGYLSAKVNPDKLDPMLIRDDRLKTFVRHFTTSRLARLLV